MNEYKKAEREVDKLGDKLADAMMFVDPEKRIEVFDRLENTWCRHCGFPQPLPDQKCQCWNDE